MNSVTSALSHLSYCIFQKHFSIFVTVEHVIITGDSTINLGDNSVNIKTDTEGKLLQILKYTFKNLVLSRIFFFHFALEGSQAHTVCFVQGREINKNNLLGGQFLVFLPEDSGK